ncbi:MAG: hypothetical protein ACTSU4_10615 [Promethearchaeota archaeon]
MSINFDMEAGHKVDGCPFSNTCKLPKNLTACVIPACKICPEYQARVKKFNRSSS